MKRIGLIIVVFLLACLMACPKSTVMVQRPGQRVYVSGFGTNVGTVNALGDFDVFEVPLNTTLEQIAEMFKDYPNMSVELTADGLRVTGGGVSNRRVPAPVANVSQSQPTEGFLVISNFTRVDIPVTVTNAQEVKNITAKSLRTTVIPLPPGQYILTIANRTETITIETGTLLTRQLSQ